MTESIKVTTEVTMNVPVIKGTIISTDVRNGATLWITTTYGIYTVYVSDNTTEVNLHAVISGQVPATYEEVNV